MNAERGDGLDLAVRIGVATGNVAVGDLNLIGEGASEEANVFGQAPNLADRLQDISEPNTVVIGEATHKLTGGLFETKDLGAQDFKGLSDPVGARAARRLDNWILTKNLPGLDSLDEFDTMIMCRNPWTDHEYGHR